MATNCTERTRGKKNQQAQRTPNKKIAITHYGKMIGLRPIILPCALRATPHPADQRFAHHLITPQAARPGAVALVSSAPPLFALLIHWRHFSHPSYCRPFGFRPGDWLLKGLFYPVFGPYTPFFPFCCSATLQLTCTRLQRPY